MLTDYDFLDLSLLLACLPVPSLLQVGRIRHPAHRSLTRRAG